MHPHTEIDIVTLVLKGRIRHQGSLGDGSTFQAYEVQIQRAGGHGLVHNEINPDADWNHVLQIWLLPEQRGQQSEYRILKVKPGAVTRVYGGAEGEVEGVLPAETVVDIIRLGQGEVFQCEGAAQVYVAEGYADLADVRLEPGDFVGMNNPKLVAQADCTLISLRCSAKHIQAKQPH